MRDEGDALPEWTSEELALLRSADADAPSARSLPAALAAVGVSGAIVAAATGAQAASTAVATSAAATSSAVAASGAAAKWTGALALSKWIAVVALSGAAVAGGVVLSRHSHAIEPPVAHATRGSTHAPQHNAKPPTAVPAAATPTTPEPPPAPAHATKPDLARSAAVPKPAATQPDIHLEIAALDAALATLRAGHARETLIALDRYDATFGKHSALRVEATALRIEALAQSGAQDKAAALGRGFLERHPSSPYAARIRALLAADSQR